MATVVAEEELYRSCRIIFGKDLKVSQEFLQYLQLSGIKKAYRKRALEIHPDKGGSQNLTLQQSMAHQFIDVHEAYKNLVSYLEARDKGLDLNTFSAAVAGHPGERGEKWSAPFSPTENRRSSTGKTNIYRFGNNNEKQRKSPLNEVPLDPKSLYRGPMPNCPLLFGRYLYYSGIISLHTIGQALIWQRTQRPRLGEIGRRYGWLDEKDTMRILQYRRDRQLFGELALRLGILTREQLHLILLQQKKLHKRIGQYFVAKNYWDDVILDKYIAAHIKHNTIARNGFA